MRGGDSSTTTSVQLAATTVGGGGVGGAHHEAAGSEVGGNNNNNSGGEMMDIELGGERSFGGNRWPRQETLALLRIRSEMDVAFRDASVKAPLWDEVSRKLGELGFNRSAKKCKEKFENVYKYHKRTKESRTGKQEGKTYRFFDELQAFDQINNNTNNNHPPPPPLLSLPPPQPQSTPPVITIVAPPMPVINQPSSSTVTSTTVPPPSVGTNMPPYSSQPIANLTIPSFPPPITNAPISASFASLSPDLLSNSTSSSTSSDVEMQGRDKRKRKWKDFFERLMRQVIERQEQMQRKFLEAIEKREQERLAKEESWRIQEMARINREREILAQERSISSAKDSAVMAFLQKLSEQPNPQQQQQQPQQVLVTATAAPPQPPPQPQPMVTPPPPSKQPAPLQLPPQQALVLTTPNLDRSKSDINIEDRNLTSPGGPSSSRWPKPEVLALIRLRTNLDSKYQENGPKGPLWEEISAGMKRLGYNRNSKRCKEKWENINKYFKKVKESNKKRPEDSKTCPYFHELEALYKEKNSKLFDHNNVGSSSSSASQLLRAVDSSVPLMVQPEQQWPPAGGAAPVQLQSRGGDSVMEDLESDEGNNGEEDEEEEEEDEASHGYEIVANNKSASIST